MRIPSILLISVICIYSHDIRAVDNNLDNGLQAGNIIADEINAGEFLSIVGKAAKIAVPFFSTIFDVTKLIFGIGQTESPELQYLRQFSETVNLRFDRVDAQFSDIKRLINWSTVQVTYTDIESRIIAVSDALNNMYKVPKLAIDAQKQIFITSYESGYQDSGIKLYKGFMNEGNVFGTGLLGPAMQYTEPDRGKMRIFMLGILRLLFMAAKLEFEYFAIKGFSGGIVPFYVQQWQTRLERVQAKMLVTDQDVASKYNSQFLLDIESFATLNSSLGNEDFSRGLYKKLSDKYFWRDWLVIISTPSSRNRACYHMCNGFAKQLHNRDIAVASVDRQKTPINKTEVDTLVSSLRQTCASKTKTSGGCGLSFTTYPKADEMYSWITPRIRTNCLSVYAAVGTSGRQLFINLSKRIIGACGKRLYLENDESKRFQSSTNRRYTALPKRLYISHLNCGEVFFFG
ncbi:uncharacterized protein LOC134256234 [Saccostrea cucullata]|uniref:uncharacterized protein LOC134256234 n=1 Tax=Saccostrea cuccullata TaxID=36930 RepID=UPI002ED6795B